MKLQEGDFVIMSANVLLRLEPNYLCPVEKCISMIDGRISVNSFLFLLNAVTLAPTFLISSFIVECYKPQPSPYEHQ